MRPPATVIQDGRGSRTVLIHGAFASPKFWTGPLPQSMCDGRVIAYPLPAHGDWQLDNSELTDLLHLARLADAYAEAIQQDFAGQPVTILGHSTGAFVASIVAARHSSLVERLALIGGFVDGSFAGADTWLKRTALKSNLAPAIVGTLLRTWTATPTTFRAGMANMIESWDQTRYCPDFDRICERVRLDLRECKTDSLLVAMKWLCRTRIWDQVSGLGSRTLVIGGGCDRVVSFAHQQQMATHFGCPIAALDDMGHLPMVEQSTWFAGVIDDWISSSHR